MLFPLPAISMSPGGDTSESPCGPLCCGDCGVPGGSPVPDMARTSSLPLLLLSLLPLRPSALSLPVPDLPRPRSVPPRRRRRTRRAPVDESTLDPSSPVPALAAPPRPGGSAEGEGSPGGSPLALSRAESCALWHARVSTTKKAHKSSGVVLPISPILHPQHERVKHKRGCA